MSKRLEWFYDVVSPTSYLAWSQLPALAARTGAELVIRPMFQGGVMQATGNRPPGTVAAKGKWMGQDLQRFARRYGVTLNSNPHFPMNTLPIQRVSIARKDQPDFHRFLDAMFAACWLDQKNVGDRDVLSAVVAAAGYDVAEFWREAEDDANKAALKANTEEAVARGVFGSPSFFVGDELFFGQDRLDFVEEALRA
jgi:2-hydroxychromene-2-carboxylate isomerase